jgi:lipid-A-disaccharide synthase
MVAAEASGDLHGAALVRALRERFPQLQVYGLGGDHMRAAGVETLFDVQALNVVGVVEILAKVPSGLRIAYQLLRTAARRGTQVVVLIDAPGFNLTFARLAKRAGLSVVYYISPQIWAWRQGRVKRVARYVDKMLTLFPFEVPFYTAAGVDAEYVGHPLLDRLHHLPAPTQAARSLGLDAQTPIVALLPGSRRQELRNLLPTMLAAFQRIRQRLPSVQGIIPWRQLSLWTKSSSS